MTIIKKKCRCSYLLVKITTRNGNIYWKCSKCEATYKPNGEREYIKTKFNQIDFE
jgi:uncharacterized C2H2 Zn-finger protein